MVTVLILLAGLGVLSWGFYRARSVGKLGILAWLRSAVLMVPWLAFFGLGAVGVQLSLASVLLLLVLAIGVYITLGKRLRTTGTHSTLPDSIAPPEQAPLPSPLADSAPTTLALANAPVAPESNKPELGQAIAPIPVADLKEIQGIFGIDTFFATETISYQNGAIFKGNLRGDPDQSHAQLTNALKERLGDRYRLFFLVDNQDSRPVVVVLPSSNDPKPTSLTQALLAVGLAIATIATCMEASGLLLGFDFFSNLARFWETLAIALGILSVLAVHEMGHRWLAHHYQVRLSPPFLIPVLQIGSFGALTRFESLLPNRTALFDIAFAGPALGGLVSFVLLVIGLLSSHNDAAIALPSLLFQSSILVGILARLFLAEAIQQPIISVNPLVVVGWLGLVLTAVNLMPAGQLDGGRVVQAIYGRKLAGRTTVATLIVVALAAIINPLALYWLLVILFLQRDLETPALNELSEPNDTRAALGLLALFLMIAILLPLTPTLASRLGIGG
ncbi:MAG: site-2 protease family protein [Leptolyngbyaceae cyanobacterium SL_7_1]|nr:site-2 protease family protein [Leptolyngbyaceae cyanobacterium SL_7_1]